MQGAQTSLKDIRKEMKSFNKDMKTLMALEGMGKGGFDSIFNLALTQLGPLGLGIGVLNNQLDLTGKAGAALKDIFGSGMEKMAAQTEALTKAWAAFNQEVRRGQMEALELADAHEAAVQKMQEKIDPGHNKSEIALARDALRQIKEKTEGGVFQGSQEEFTRLSKRVAEAQNKGINLSGPTKADAERRVAVDEANAAERWQKEINEWIGEQETLRNQWQKEIDMWLGDMETDANRWHREMDQWIEDIQGEKRRSAHARELASYAQAWEEAASIIENMKSPLEKLQDSVKEYGRLMEMGALTPEQFLEASSKAGEHLMPKYQGTAALEAGSAADFSARARMMFQGKADNPGEIMAKQLIEAQKQNQLLEEIKDALDDAANDPPLPEVVDF